MKEPGEAMKRPDPSEPLGKLMAALEVANARSAPEYMAGPDDDSEMEQDEDEESPR